ncbi:MAG: hypothetical protein ACPGO3_14060 [Magnetospiraceae bacterium]
MFASAGYNHEVSKLKVRVRVLTQSGREHEGFIFVRQGERVTDLLNDDRNFIPLLLADNSTKILRKSAIEDLTQLGTPKTPPMGFGKGIMTLEEAASILGLNALRFGEADVAEAHRRMITKVHPDAGGSNYVATRVNAARDVLEDVLFQRSGVSKKASSEHSEQSEDASSDGAV